jgi:hypothetical protein
MEPLFQCYTTELCGSWRDEKCIHILVGKPEGKRILGRARCRWEDNIRMELREVGWEGVDWMLTSGGLL